jgi:thioredoxin reductase
MPRFDAVIVGGGPAGLSAALVLGRCRRNVLLCDDGQPRNAASRALHGFLTRDGISPEELLNIAREQLRAYPTVQMRQAHATDAVLANNHFEVTLENASPQTNSTATSRKLLLATGVCDNIPDIAGLRELYGTSVFHCPYCDGWEVRDQAIVVFGPSETACGLALELTAWSANLVVCTGGDAAEQGTVDRLARYGIAVRDERIERLEGSDGRLERVSFVDGPPHYCRAMFLSTGSRQRSDLAAKLGCVFNDKGAVATGEYETTNIPGLYVAGDASRLVHLAIVAAAEGAQAAFAMNTALLKEDLAAGYDVTAPA